MFTEIEGFERESVNKQSDMTPGIYSESQSLYANEDGSIQLVQREFKRDEEEAASVIDCILRNKDDEVSFQDFIRLSSGKWRAGDGSESENLLELFPAELANLYLVGEPVDGDVIEVPGVEV